MGMWLLLCSLLCTDQCHGQRGAVIKLSQQATQMLRQHFSVLAVRCGQVANLLTHVGQYLDFWNHLSLGHWACYVRRNMRAAWRP